MKPHQEVAVAFARALVDGDFEGAHELLAPELKRTLPPEALRARLAAMYERYADGPPTRILFDPEFTLEEWPAKLPGDLGSVYVGIAGDDFVEAVYVTVADGDGAPRIRDVEWGRP